jgi:hypothetical protein
LTPARLVACVCAAQVCAQIGAYTWPALLPDFLAEWRITNREAGWITGQLIYADGGASLVDTLLPLEIQRG